MANETPIGDIIAHAVGGGWGREDPAAGHSRVAIIRGTDFANIAMLNFAAIPRRYEADQKLPSRELRPDDIVLEISGGSRTSNQSTGRSLFVTAALLNTIGERTIPASFCRLIRVDPTRVFPRYAYYHLQEMYLAGRAAQYEHQSTGISNFQFTHFKESEQIRIPPQKEQQAIACILGALDDKIHLNREMNRTLEEMARAIFKSWFVDFDPVRAKVAGRTPPGLKPDIAALFPDSFDETEMGDIPAGWHTRPIGDVVQAVGGGTPSTKEPAYWDGGTHPFCTPKDMSSLTDAVLLGTERHLTDEGLAKVSSGQLPVGTVLLSSRAPIGYLAIAETPVSVNQGIIAMVCDGALPNLYVLHWTRANMDRVLANANGSTFMEISKTNFRPITAVVPTPEALRQFMQVVGPLHRRVVSSLQQIQHLAGLRDSLLPPLISGELVVAEAERIAGRAI